MINLDMVFESQITYVLITLLVATLGGFVFLKLKIPAGPLLGAMFFVMIISIFWGKCFMPKFMVIASRIIAGTLIGSRVLRSSLTSLKKNFIPVLFFAFFILALSMFAGFVIYHISGIQKSIAFFGSAPGGLIDMSLISAEFGSDMSTVALLQFVRTIACITVIPFIVKRNGRKKTENKKCSFKKIAFLDSKSCEDKSCNNKTIRFLTTIFVGSVGGVLGNISSIPAGALTGAAFFVAFFNMFFFRLYIPVKISHSIQMLIGAVIGAGMKMDDVLGLKRIIVPALMVVVFLLTIGIFLGYLLNKIWNIDINTAIIATAPGGLTVMSLIAPDLGADVSIVTSLHFVRLIALIIIYPIVMKLIL